MNRRAPNSNGISPPATLMPEPLRPSRYLALHSDTLKNRHSSWPWS